MVSREGMHGGAVSLEDYMGLTTIFQDLDTGMEEMLSREEKGIL